MASFNKCILMGNLTRDPELSQTPSGTSICKFGLATNRKWKSQSGEQREEVCFVDLTAFGRTAETLAQYMRKGSPLLVEGRLHFSQWTDREGQKRSKLEVIAERCQFLPSGQGQQQGQGQGQGYGQGQDYGQQDQQGQATGQQQPVGAQAPSSGAQPDVGGQQPQPSGGQRPDGAGPAPRDDYPPPADIDGDIPF